MSDELFNDFPEESNHAQKRIFGDIAAILAEAHKRYCKEHARVSDIGDPTDEQLELMEALQTSKNRIVMWRIKIDEIAREIEASGLISATDVANTAAKTAQHMPLAKQPRGLGEDFDSPQKRELGDPNTIEQETTKEPTQEPPQEIASYSALIVHIKRQVLGESVFTISDKETELFSSPLGLRISARLSEGSVIFSAFANENLCGESPLSVSALIERGRGTSAEREVSLRVPSQFVRIARMQAWIDDSVPYVPFEKESEEQEKAEKQRHGEDERLEAERLEAERIEKERVEKERLEAERLENERLENERLEAERLENERIEKERLEAERLENERLEAERLENERLEAERL
ncbi:MAG: hypothetical protein LBT59_15285, partial [Clostridiales bacterium]|nr:hypothetical protein [Clostridiales bacterium]